MCDQQLRTYNPPLRYMLAHYVGAMVVVVGICIDCVPRLLTGDRYGLPGVVCLI